MRWAQGLERPHAAENAEVVLESIRRAGIIFAEQRAYQRRALHRLQITAQRRPRRVGGETVLISVVFSLLGALAVFLARERTGSCENLGRGANTGTNGGKGTFIFLRGPRSGGVFYLVVVMLGTLDFFETQIGQCKSAASQCTNKNDQDFWLKMAARWEGLLKARLNGDGGVVRPSRFGRSVLAKRFAKRRRAA